VESVRPPNRRWSDRPSLQRLHRVRCRFRGMTARDERAARIKAIVEEILARPVDYEKLAAREAARTDPWRWYCRLCGATGAFDHGETAREQRDGDARAHLDETRCGRHGMTGWTESGRLLHV
jgi:hypothetical protein